MGKCVGGVGKVSAELYEGVVKCVGYMTIREDDLT